MKTIRPAYPLPLGATRVRVVLIDENDEEVGTAEIPLVIESPALQDSLDRLLVEVIRLRETIEIVAS